VQLISVWVAEGHSGKWCATAWVVDDVLDDTSNVSVSLGIVYGSELGWVLVEPLVGSEDRAAALPLIAGGQLALNGRRRGICVPNNATHGELWVLLFE
jgi:hypothetical protein